MYKIIMLVMTLYSVTALSEPLDNACASLAFERQPDRQVAFYYQPPDESDKPYFYAKAMAGLKSAEATLATFSTKGEPLKQLPFADPQPYQAPAKAKKLYILVSATPFKAAGLLARVNPHVTAENRTDRNPSAFHGPLALETTTLVNKGDNFQLCELSL